MMGIRQRVRLNRLKVGYGLRKQVSAVIQALINWVTGSIPQIKHLVRVDSLTIMACMRLWIKRC